MFYKFAVIAWVFISYINAVEIQNLTKHINQYLLTEISSEYPSVDTQSITSKIVNYPSLLNHIAMLPKDTLYEISNDSRKKWSENVSIKLNFFSPEGLFISSYTVFIENKIQVDVWKATTDLSVGDIVEISDLDKSKKNLYNINKSLIMTHNNVLGKEVRIKVKKNEYIRRWHLREKVLVKKGQEIYVQKVKKNLVVKVTGKALEDGHLDKVISIRMPSGKIVNGKVRSEETVIYTH